jgi:hypothetical protein
MEKSIKIFISFIIFSQKGEAVGTSHNILFDTQTVSVRGLGALLNKWFIEQSCGSFLQRHLTSTITPLWGHY